MYRRAGPCHVLYIVLIWCMCYARAGAASAPSHLATGAGPLQKTATHKLLLEEKHPMGQPRGRYPGLRTLQQSAGSIASETRRGMAVRISSAGDGRRCTSFLEMAANVPAVGPSDGVAASVEAGVSCAARPQPLATLGGRCRIVCEKPEDLKRVVMAQIQILSAPANYLPPNPPDAAAGSSGSQSSTAGGTAAGSVLVDPVYCQLQVTAAPLVAECQLEAYAVCCQP